MYLLIEDAELISAPKNVKQHKEKITMECILQDTDVYNRNRRKYPKKVLKESIDQIIPRIKAGELFGELDHPVDANPTRQCTVRFHDASHQFKEIGWDGNKVIGVVETLAATPNGKILRDLVIKDGIFPGFSYRGMGELKTINENGKIFHDVLAPLTSISWDVITHPSHEIAKMIKLRESDCENIKEEAQHIFSEMATVIYEDDHMICTNEGVCYLPNEFERIINGRIKELKGIFNIY